MLDAGPERFGHGHQVEQEPSAHVGADSEPKSERQSEPEYTRPVAALAHELTHLAGHLTAAMYRWIVLVGEFDARRGWAQEGSRSCVDWLGWKCGISANTAREQLRVAAALPKLPGIESAFARGKVSYSKVRAMTRVATPGNEDALLNYALHGTTAHLEMLCRLVRRQDEGAAVDAQAAAHANRACRWFVERDGSVSVRATLPAELGATVVKALEAAQALLRDAAPHSGQGEDETPTASPTGSATGSATDACGHTDARGHKAGAAGAPESSEAASAADQPESSDAPESEDARDEREIRSPAARRADALVHVAESFLSNPASETARADERHQVVVHVSAETLGTDESSGGRHDTTADSQRAETAGGHGEVDKADKSREHDGSAGRRGAGASSGCGRVHEHAADSATGTATRPDPCGCGEGEHTAGPGDRARHGYGSGLLDDTPCHIEGISAVPRDTARRIACDACVVNLETDEDGNPLDIGRRSRQLSPALRRALRARDRGCRFPGCGCERWVEAHHIVHWADGGRTALDNLVGLCRYHHRLVHEGGYTIAFDADGRTVATTPEGDVLRETPSPVRPGSTSDLFDERPVRRQRSGGRERRREHSGARLGWLRARLPRHPDAPREPCATARARERRPQLGPWLEIDVSAETHGGPRVGPRRRRCAATCSGSSRCWPTRASRAQIGSRPLSQRAGCVRVGKGAV